MIRHQSKILTLATLALVLCVGTVSAQPFVAPDPDLTGAVLEITLSGKLVTVDKGDPLAADPSTYTVAKPKLEATKKGKTSKKQTVIGRLAWNETSGWYDVVVISEQSGGAFDFTGTGTITVLDDDSKGNPMVEFEFSFPQNNTAPAEISKVWGIGTQKVNAAKIGAALSGINEVQTLDLNGATSGSFNLMFAGTTSTTPVDVATADAAAVTGTLLTAGLVSTDFAVAGNATDGFTITFAGDLADQNVEEIVVVDIDTDVLPTITETTEGAVGRIPVPGSIKVEKTGLQWTGTDYGKANTDLYGSPNIKLKFQNKKVVKPYDEI